MASSVPFVSVSLTEDEVPGAKLSDKPISAHSIVELKRWLQCRDQNSSGKKSELVERVGRCLELQCPISITIDKGKWYDQKVEGKRQGLIRISENSPLFPITGWRQFPSKRIPKNFNYGHIYKHLILSAIIVEYKNNNNNNKENLSDSSSEDDGCAQTEYDTTKSLRRGKMYFKSGNISELQDHSDDQVYCLKSKVMSSFKENVIYNVMIMLKQQSGEVLDSSCECVASKMGRCSHNAALLLALENYVDNFGVDPPACTSKICQWNKGRAKKAPSVIHSRTYDEVVDPSQKSTFVPYTVLVSVSDSDCDTHTNKLLSLLSKDRTENEEPVLFELMLQYNYDDYTILDERKSEPLVNMEQLRQALCFNSEIPCEVPGTINQSSSDLWNSLRGILITASKCKAFSNMQEDDLNTKIREHMWFPKTFTSKYTSLGLDNELNAINAYINRTGYQVCNSGLWINPNYIGLGASPDGIVYDSETNSYGLLEVKCPYILKDFYPHELEKLSPTQRSAFCCKMENGTLVLKTSHKYYFQVQMQMGVLEKSWCDFVVWTFKDLDVQRIYFNSTFWKNTYSKLCEIHRKFICPEYFEMRTPRKLSLIKMH